MDKYSIFDKGIVIWNGEFNIFFLGFYFYFIEVLEDFDYIILIEIREGILVWK